MRRLIAGSLAAAALTFAVAGMPVLAADAEPTVHQIYEAANSGRLDQAQQMMNEVLRNHPDSAKAHFVQAELYAREGNAELARGELRRAEGLKPGLPDVSPQALQSLKSELGLGQRGEGRFGSSIAPAAPHFPWGMLMIFAVAIGVLWMLFRRRSGVVPYPAGTSPAGGAPAAYGPAGYGPGGYGAPGGVGSGIGGSIAGGLASGLAVGAGVVAGEELAHHFLDGRRESGAVLPPAGDDTRSSNSDMGGTDFGVDDPGSWDGGGDSGGGGGDWS